MDSSRRQRGQLHAPRPTANRSARPRRCSYRRHLLGRRRAWTQCRCPTATWSRTSAPENFLGGAIKLACSAPATTSRRRSPTRSASLGRGCGGRRDQSCSTSPSRVPAGQHQRQGCSRAEFPASPTVVPGGCCPMATPRASASGTWWCRPGRRVSRLSAVPVPISQYRYDKSSGHSASRSSPATRTRPQPAPACRKPGASWR